MSPVVQGQELLLREKTIKFLSRSMAILPPTASSYDNSRMTIAFFAICGLDILNEDSRIQESSESIREWIKKCYVCDEANDIAGFHGGTFIRTKEYGHLRAEVHVGHIAMTYTAIACLKILGDDINQFNVKALVNGVKKLQQPNGSFDSSTEGGENDMRFVFCAAAICSMLDDWAGMDQESAIAYILSSITYEGGIAQGPNMEAHGGSTYCAIATLSLLNRMDVLSKKQRSKLYRWCCKRLDEGFTGRPNKPSDTCYSFWVGATLKLLSTETAEIESANRLIERSSNFVLDTQDMVKGGFAKCEDVSPDPLHTQLGLGGMSLFGYPGLSPLNPALNITYKSMKKFESH